MTGKIWFCAAVLAGVLGASMAQAGGGCAIDTGAKAQVEALVNAQRQAKGLGALPSDPRLDAAARRHACDMLRKGYFDHRGSDGTMPKHRIAASGFRACLSAENIALDWRTPADVVHAWMVSPGHAANILRRGVERMGTAFVPRQGDHGPWVVQVFAKGC